MYYSLQTFIRQVYISFRSQVNLIVYFNYIFLCFSDINSDFKLLYFPHICGKTCLPSPIRKRKQYYPLKFTETVLIVQLDLKNFLYSVQAKISFFTHRKLRLHVHCTCSIDVKPVIKKNRRWGVQCGNGNWSVCDRSYARAHSTAQ